MHFPRLAAVAILLTLSSAAFVARGVLRALDTSHDLAPVYGAARAFVQGENPYDGPTLTRALLEGGRAADTAGRRLEGGAIYAPFTLTATAPLGALRWQEARVVFLVVSLALVIWQLRALVALTGLPLSDAAGLALVAVVIGLAPLHTGLAFGQLAIPCASLVVIALARMRNAHPTSAGALLGLAVLLKPQLAAPFVLYAALRDHRRAAAIAVAVVAVATFAALGWLAFNEVAWYGAWRESLASVTAGAEHDPGGRFGSQLVDLRPVLAAIGLSHAATLAFALAATAGVILYVQGRALPRDDDLLIASTVATLTLLATYHRVYDAALLALPVAWAFQALRTRPHLRRHALMALGCSALFVIWPGGWTLQRAADAGVAPARLAESGLWNVFLLRHQNWALILLTIALLVAIRQHSRVAQSAPH